MKKSWHTALDWEEQPPEMYREVISMAIALEMTRLAYYLAQQGHAHYPDDEELRKAEYVLAPAKAVKSDYPPIQGLSNSMKWLKDHAQDCRGKWVAVLNGELLKTGASYQELVEALGETAQTHGLLVEKL